MIAMALVHNPAVLIADEPTTALDVTVQAQILELIDHVKRDFDVGVILITHDLGVVSETASHVMVMYGGRAMEYGTAEEIFRGAQHPYTWGLLESMPSIDKKLDVLLPIEGSPPSMLNPPTGCPFNPRCKYRFEPCTQRVPPLEAIPNGHRDACFLAPEQKRDVWREEGRDRDRGEPVTATAHAADATQTGSGALVEVREPDEALRGEAGRVRGREGDRPRGRGRELHGQQGRDARDRRRVRLRQVDDGPADGAACSTRRPARSSSTGARSRTCHSHSCGRSAGRCRSSSRIRTRR